MKSKFVIAVTSLLFFAVLNSSPAFAEERDPNVQANLDEAKSMIEGIRKNVEEARKLVDELGKLGGTLSERWRIIYESGSGTIFPGPGRGSNREVIHFTNMDQAEIHQYKRIRKIYVSKNGPEHVNGRVLTVITDHAGNVKHQFEIGHGEERTIKDNLGDIVVIHIPKGDTTKEKPNRIYFHHEWNK